MTDQEIMDTIKASAEATSAVSVFYNHVFCLLARRSGVDLKVLAEDVRSLTQSEGSEVFQKLYNATADQLALNLEDIYQEQTSAD